MLVDSFYLRIQTFSAGLALLDGDLLSIGPDLKTQLGATDHSSTSVTNGSFATPSSASQHPRHPRDLGLPALRTSSPRFGTCTAFFSSNYTLTTLSPPTLT
ncbi:BZ3500_MvSof-1268-A1-R1_C044g00116 [Microbotryum saponariae]|nr:BZ3501_MvSof-1269-A2-R1_C69g00387 [Microbotryum saponariae]SCZ92734.1 BZ3501_MvSof-1269-A2-R1_Chr1-1g00409 [Microbotryum saponariae]SCZ92972.1 BZ3500_MvSof-1268-A1-R1_C071g00362 [Microbotryum saponariae]SCZ92999.1 BZ3500_MvSof-1268-A1-R1_C077g00405 [Microbotryum saponariae]SCZ93016.1 BZ3500_MvSof-1268-A1-R1_C074g00386 [Microbotryum saponariae]